VTLAIAAGGNRSTVCATDEVSNRLEELQVSFSEGPSVEALDRGWPVLAADMAAAANRWGWYAPAAVDAGAAAQFALPLQVGAIRLGVLTLYRATPGDLTAEQFADARTLAEAATILLTLDQPGSGSVEAFLWVVNDRSRFRAEVHQAVGVTMVQLGVDVRDAFARICAYAYANELPIGRVADDIIGRRLRLEPQ
jgi:hypothetical protein